MHRGSEGITPYRPTALYFSDSDIVEYVRFDEPSVCRRIDNLLTLVLSLETRDTIGFQLKGFKNFYLRYIRSELDQEAEFLELVKVLETALKVVGEQVFKKFEVRDGYEQASSIAADDNVSLYELPEVA